jgi:ATP-dependent DNA helicase Rep
VLARWRDRFRYVMVDEYQDTNRAQLELLRHLAGEHRNICVVGDDDQSIYAWRGADVRNILEFEEHFPGATIVKLEQNYRSVGPILEVANAVISKRLDAKYPKRLFTEKEGGDKVVSLVAPTPDAEAKHVAAEIRRLIRDEGRRPKDIAVLYRSNGQSTTIEACLREQGVAYRLVGGTQFFERKEVKDVLAYMKLALHPTDEIALRRIINYPARGIGETSVERLATHALARGWTLWQAVERVDALDDIPPVARDGCKALEQIVAAARKSIFLEKQPSAAIARAVSEHARLREEVQQSSGSADLASKRWGNVEALFQTFAKRDGRAGDRANEHDGGLGSFVQALTLQFDDGTDEGEKDVVTLSTLHGSKGLEFDIVFLLGCEEGLLPHQRTLVERANDAVPADIEEERRLFYVGVTRARQRLFLSRAKARAMRGKGIPRTPSRFLLDVPAELLEEREVTGEAAMSTDEMAASANALLAALSALE